MRYLYWILVILYVLFKCKFNHTFVCSLFLEVLDSLRVASPKPGHAERIHSPIPAVPHQKPVRTFDRFLKINVRHITDGQVQKWKKKSDNHLGNILNNSYVGSYLLNFRSSRKKWRKNIAFVLVYCILFSYRFRFLINSHKKVQNYWVYRSRQ